MLIVDEVDRPRLRAGVVFTGAEAGLKGIGGANG